MNTRKSPRYSNRQRQVKGRQRPTTCGSFDGGKYPERVSEAQDPAPGTPPPSGRPATLALALFGYTVARMLLVVVIAAVILFGGKLVGVDVPFLVAAVFGVLIALPLGMYLFKSLRLKVNGEIAAIEADRRARHDDLQSRLRGDR